MKHIAQSAFVVFYAALLYACGGTEVDSHHLPKDGLYQTAIELSLGHPAENSRRWSAQQALVGSGIIELDTVGGTVTVRMTSCELTRQVGCEPLSCDRISLPAFPLDDGSFGPIIASYACGEVVVPAPAILAQVKSDSGMEFIVEDRRTLTVGDPDGPSSWGTTWGGARRIPTAEELDLEWMEGR